MNTKTIGAYSIEYVEQYVPMAKPLAYWHVQALGFRVDAFKGIENGYPGIASYLLSSGDIRIVLTSAYPTHKSRHGNEILDFIREGYAGVKRIALRTPSVKDSFDNALSKGAIPIKFPTVHSDENGQVEEASIRLYDNNEIVFMDRSRYSGVFLPGYRKSGGGDEAGAPLFDRIDHIASELRMNQIAYWTDYLEGAIGTRLVQQIADTPDNKTGMLLNINQTVDKGLTLVMAEPSGVSGKSKVQENIDNYGPGIHHLAFSTSDIIATVRELKAQKVELVSFPGSYYELLRADEELRHFDIDELEANGILLDKEDDSCLLQKFVKPYGDRPFFIYEIVQRVNGYSGFALKNINVLKKAEEIELMKA